MKKIILEFEGDFEEEVKIQLSAEHMYQTIHHMQRDIQNYLKYGADNISGIKLKRTRDMKYLLKSFIERLNDATKFIDI